MEQTAPALYGAVTGKRRASSSIVRPSEVPAVWMLHGALVCAYCCWGMTAVVSKLGIHAANVVLFELLHQVFAAPFFILVSFHITGRVSPDRCDMRKVLLVGFCFFVQQICYFMGLKLTDPVTCAIWQNSVPVFTTGLAVLMGQEALSKTKAVGILLAVAGAASMSLHISTELPDLGFTHVTFDPVHVEEVDKLRPARRSLGNLCFLVQALAASCYILMSKELVQRYSAISVVGWAHGASAFGTLGVFVFASRSHDLATYVCWDKQQQAIDSCLEHMMTVEKGMIVPLFGEIVLASFVGMSLVMWANRYTKASIVSVYMVAMPVMSSILAVCLTQIWGWQVALQFGIRAPGLAQIAGILLIFCGLFFALQEGATTEEVQQPTESAANSLGAAASSGECSQTRDA